MDQASTLRDLAADGACTKGRFDARVIAVSSGKGGVGKTSASVNLAVAFARMGRRVLLLDADLGLGNVDVMLGIAPRYNLGHVLRGEKAIDDVIVEGPAGIMILPASSGIQELTDLDTEERLSLASHLERLSSRADMVIIDTGAGISDNVLFFNTAAQEIVVVVSPEPTSLTDAYALMKVMRRKHSEKTFRLLVNLARTRREGLDVYRKISLAAEKFLGVAVDYLGCVLADDNVQRAVVSQRPVMELYPRSSASLCYSEIAGVLDGLPAVKGPKGGVQFFWNQMLLSGA